MKSKRLVIASTMIAGALFATASASQAARATCVLAGGEATMITQDMAQFMANAALKNSIKGMGATGQGAVKVACNAPSPLTYCKAQQRACK